MCKVLILLYICPSTRKYTPNRTNTRERTRKKHEIASRNGENGLKLVKETVNTKI